LTRSKVKVTGLLNFRQLAKPCMLAAMTAAPLRDFLVNPCFLKFVCSSSESACTVNDVELRTPRSNIRELAMAMLQIEQMIESRYLNPPLGMQAEAVCVFFTSFCNVAVFIIFMCVYELDCNFCVCLKFAIVSVSGESVVRVICVFVSILFLLIQLDENL